MVTFNVELEVTKPQIHVEIPLGEYLLDDEQVELAKQKIEGIINLCGHSFNSDLFLNGEPISSDRLRDIVEKSRSLYLLQLLENVLDRVRPLEYSFIREITEKIDPLIERSKDMLKRGYAY